jgi:predicted transcriptional regulator
MIESESESIMQTKVVTAHIPLPLSEKVDDLAKTMDRSRGWIMKQALSDWVDKEEWRHRLTMEGLAAVDAGDVVDGEVVTAWVDSLGTEHPLPKPR